MVKEIVAAHKIAHRHGILGPEGYNLATPEIFSLECEDPVDFLDEGIVEHSLVLCRYVSEHQDGKINVYYKKDESPQFRLSKKPLKGWEIMGCAMFTINFYE